MLAHTVPTNSDEFKGYPLARRQTASHHICKEKWSDSPRTLRLPNSTKSGDPWEPQSHQCWNRMLTALILCESCVADMTSREQWVLSYRDHPWEHSSPFSYFYIFFYPLFCTFGSSQAGLKLRAICQSLPRGTGIIGISHFANFRDFFKEKTNTQ